MARILVVDDDPGVVALVDELLREDGHEVATAGSADDARQQADQELPDLVVTDIEMPSGHPTGLELLQYLHGLAHGTPVVLLTGRGTKERAIQALREGASDFIEKPFEAAELVQRVRAVLASVPRPDGAGPGAGDDRTAGVPLPEAASHFETLVGESQGMRAVYRLIERVARTDLTVLVLGESGTGKELVARALHAGSRRAAMPFVAINCAALPEALLESELFGHRKGAFTGASTDKLGLLESAAGGTVLLDEIGSMPLVLQSKLLRFLQDREFRRVGDTATRRVDLRVIAATNEPLLERVERQAFREDLYYRLSVIPIHLPPLRARPGDIPLLAGQFARTVARRLQRRLPTITADALACLESWPWPGNVRELQNIVERAFLLGDHDSIRCSDLPSALTARDGSAGNHRAAALPSPATGTAPADTEAGGALVRRGLVGSVPLKEYLLQVEADYIARAVQAANSNKQRAATLLGVSLTTLYRKLGTEAGTAEPVVQGET